MRVLRFATTNPHKVREVRGLLDSVPVQVETLAHVPAAAEPEETAATFEGNARIKALHYASRHPGEYVVSEDSGLEVDALGGAPGVQSARFLGPDATYAARFDEILRRLRDVPEAGRTARFVCALAVAKDGALLFETRGVVEGRIAYAPAGDGGFGYDPIFFSPALGCTLAEAGDVKATVSHRAQAVAALLHWVRDLK
ncbi:MAG: non-canonical purine NTP pyrophosphatase [Acidobacteria bacterium]|nr:non-canonical purine NTP pyrophosphatase [Acidobacteriota bacterium]